VVSQYALNAHQDMYSLVESATRVNTKQLDNHIHNFWLVEKLVKIQLTILKQMMLLSVKQN
jgi:hypothetical protein